MSKDAIEMLLWLALLAGVIRGLCDYVAWEKSDRQESDDRRR